MNKKVIISLIIIIVVILIGTIGIIIIKNNDTEIPDDYIAVFNGGAGEVTYSTYVYKIDNGQANYGFKYINTINTTKYWGSSESNSEITSKGIVSWTDEIFKIAEENNAYSYVKLPNNEKIYSIQEFIYMFSMD